MGIKKQRQVHKKLDNYSGRLEVIEGILRGGLWVALIISITGLVITYRLDQIRGRIIEIDWLQITGMSVFAGLIFMCLFILWLIKKK